MQAVLLAAGQSSRFYPFTSLGHKSFFLLLDKPIIFHTLRSIQQAGIKEVLIVVQKKNEFCDYLSSLFPSLSIQFIEQPTAEGMGDALLRVSEYIKNDFFLLHAHHVDFEQFYSDMMLAKQSADGVFLAKKTENISRYGVLKLEGERVVEIIEKPAKGSEPSNLRLIGIYLLPLSFLHILKNAPLEHYNFESALSKFVKKNTFRVTITNKEVVTLKYPWDIFSISHFLLERINPFVSHTAKVAQTAIIKGNVIVEDGATISDGVKIKGPCFIGKNVFIGDNSLIRNYTVINENCVIGANTEIRNSIFQPGTKIHSGFVGDSVIGKKVSLAAGFYTANKKLNRGEISVKTTKGEERTGLKSLGVCIGDNVCVGIRVTTMPGTIIGENAIIGPSTTVMKNVPERTRYYTVFQEIIEKHVTK
jgi:bifunctional UDP-N-acetylglucosamine pyrophosphorylase/glucosamine-1-phosphate N-acetyltransferase